MHFIECYLTIIWVIFGPFSYSSRRGCSRLFNPSYLIHYSSLIRLWIIVNNYLIHHLIYYVIFFIN